MKSNYHTFFLALIMLLGLIPSLLAQQERDEDVVHLKNGSVIRGEIIEREIGSHIKVQIFGGTVMVFQEEEVKAILREPRVYTDPVPKVVKKAPVSREEKKKHITYREKGFYQLFSVGIQSLSQDFFLVPGPSSLNYRTGYSFSKNLNLGIGFGVEAFENFGTIPFYLDYHGEIGKERKTMPHYFVHAGYAFGAWGQNGWVDGNVTRQDFRGGPMGYAGGGIKLNFRRRTEMIFTIGYKAMSLHADFESEQPIFDNNGLVIGFQAFEGTFDTFYNSIVLQASFGF